ncbi:MAG: hypothetical protein E6554_09605 [Bacteroides sp.]|nr:hypothetical protein [Bacteroides sp.]
MKNGKKRLSLRAKYRVLCMVNGKTAGGQALFLAIWKGIEEFGLTLLNTKHLLYLSKFCRFFASSCYI